MFINTLTEQNKKTNIYFPLSHARARMRIHAYPLPNSWNSRSHGYLISLSTRIQIFKHLNSPRYVHNASSSRYPPNGKDKNSNKPVITGTGRWYSANKTQSTLTYSTYTLFLPSIAYIIELSRHDEKKKKKTLFRRSNASTRCHVHNSSIPKEINR